MKTFLFPVLLFLIFVSAASAQSGPMALRYCDVCGDHPWLVTEPSGEKVAEAATANSDTVVFRERERVIARLKDYDRSLPKDKVVEAALRERGVISAEPSYRPDGLLPKKIIKTALAVHQNDSVIAKEEERNAFPWELLTLFLSAVFFALAWMFLGSENEESLPCQGCWIIPLAAVSAYLCGVSISGLILQESSNLQIFLSFTLGGLMMGFVGLIVYLGILILSMLMVGGLSKIFKGIDIHNKVGESTSILLCLTISLLALSSILPLSSEARNIPSAIFTIFLPGMTIALLGQFALRRFLAAKKKKIAR